MRAGMQDGFYWIQYKGQVQIALLLTGGAEETGHEQKVHDYWLIDGGIEVENDDNIKVISGPLDIVV